MSYSVHTWYGKKEIEEIIIEFLNVYEGKISLQNMLQYSESRPQTSPGVYKALRTETFIEAFNTALPKLPHIHIEKDDNGKCAIYLKENCKEKNSQSDIAAAETPIEDLPKRMKILLDFLNSGLYEKEEAVRLALLGVIAGENIVLVGSTGSAKSMIARKLTHIFREDSSDKPEYFEYRLNKFTTPNDLLDAVSIKALEQDKDKKNSERSVPKAFILFLDGIDDSSPVMLSTLLSIVDEKKIHDDKNLLDIPITGLLAASNDISEENLRVLWDRFVIRIPVRYVRFENNFCEMITSNSCDTDEDVSDETVKAQSISEDELKEWRKLIDMVEVPANIKSVIFNISANDFGSKVSDRRWKKIIRILRTCAFLNGRNYVDITDVSLVANCIASDVYDTYQIKKTVKQIIGVYSLEISTDIDEIKNKIKKFDNKISGVWYEKDGYSRNLIKKEKLFGTPAGYTATKEKFDKDDYRPIADSIKSEQEKLAAYKAEQGCHFKSNLFIDPTMADYILEKIDSKMMELENAKADLDEAQNRYAK